MTQATVESAIALGIGTKNRKGEWLEVFFPQILVNPSPALIQALEPISESTGHQGFALELFTDDLKSLIQGLSSFAEAETMVDQAMRWMNTAQPVALVFSKTQQEPAGVPEIYLHLQMLSRRLVKPHGISLVGIFGKLKNIAWTSLGPIDLEELPQVMAEARAEGECLQVRSVDKFPPMLDYVVPDGVRIADGSRVRLGAYLGKGTTVMHEGFVNFNAGTLGASMVEGRISAGVVVGNGSDLGGGCSTMGTLSGGNSTVISVGENCLLGANAGLGIPLGDRCTIEAGLYLTAGAKVAMLDDAGQMQGEVKAASLAGKSDLLFRRNSRNGRIECLTNKSAIELNQELHDHN